MRLLVVEDEPSLNVLLVKQLTAAHYSVDGCLDGLDDMDYLAGAEYDALVLEIMLPGISGLEMLRRLRAKGDKTPVLLLTARDGTEDHVKGLDSGADDYLVKPFAFDELLARLRVLIRHGASRWETKKTRSIRWLRNSTECLPVWRTPLRRKSSSRPTPPMSCARPPQ